ncbi:MAG: membrane protein insertion efficiency factor YidD [Myxococcales bacterium]|nr:membrane protein insertion efficiency factor YidD [Myxococcales bacterium]MCH7867888.1 membrane protein insertion efficiency factor YidD [Myxococcales bacterium]
MTRVTTRETLGIARSIAIFAIRLYQILISPFFAPACRFAPSCSQYAIDAVGRHGVLRGCSLAARRLVKCHPLHEGGFDPVP